MPFGLKNAPTTFQRLVNQIFDRLSDYVASYIDDVAIFSLSWPEHLVHLEQVFEVLKSAGLTLNAWLVPTPVSSWVIRLEGE